MLNPWLPCPSMIIQGALKLSHPVALVLSAVVIDELSSPVERIQCLWPILKTLQQLFEQILAGPFVYTVYTHIYMYI
jgi:hypothetical protein